MAKRAPIEAPHEHPDATRILGLDLAIGTTGWAFLRAGRPEAHGSFTLPDRRRGESRVMWNRRRATVQHEQLALLLAEHRPELVAYEFPDAARPWWSGGSKGREFSAVQGLALAEGFLVALWAAGAPRLVAVPASSVRRAAAGRENANKDQVAYGLRTYRGWDLAGWSEDEVDAAAVALAAREGMTA